MSDYPEHDKLTSIKAMSQPMGELLEWLEDNGYFIATYEKTSHDQEVIVPVRKTISLWLAEIFAIDLAALDKEKDMILAAYREKAGVQQ